MRVGAVHPRSYDRLRMVNLRGGGRAYQAMWPPNQRFRFESDAIRPYFPERRTGSSRVVPRYRKSQFAASGGLWNLTHPPPRLLCV
jgi:hypothetical protein